MGKNDFLSPKAIGNRIKAKGLQKLRWYCQLCQKQCRDENGFKCHQMSDSHRRQMEVFGQNPNRVVSGYSEEFERDFMDHLKRAHPFSRVSAKVVYNEFIQDRNHIHMNSTKWLTLTGFVQYLGREGKCKVEDTPKGWYITLIQRDPNEELSEEKRNKRMAAEKAEEERHLSLLAEQVERARKMARTADEADHAQELKRDELDGPLVLNLGLGKAPAAAASMDADGGDGEAASTEPSALGQPARQKMPGQRTAAIHSAPAKLFQDEDDSAPPASASGRGGSESGPAIPLKMSKVEMLMKKELEAKAAKAKNSGGHWLVPGIIVKVMSKHLKEHGYYKQKGKVQRVIDGKVGEICMLDSGDVLRVDELELETVIPSPGGSVLVLNGMFRGSQGSLLSIDTARFQAHVKITAGQDKGKEVWLEYEDISKLA